ncbi:MAG: hypothetical protein KatS3mg120_0679 [Erythrobacter sp.]|nr:MAG: hypothetical protein KatS3mg120_0679 [Erythrobacter sp.]
MEISANTPAVVTGGASGLGAATARALAAKGAKVAIFDMNEEKGNAVAAEIGGVFCKVNVTSDADVDAGFAKAREAHGQERILVNCAGIGNAIKTASRSKEDGSIKHFPISAFDFVIQVNLIGTFRCIAKSAAGMLTLDPLSEDGERGAIVNTASVAAEDGQMGQAAYSASKAGRGRHDPADRPRPDGRRHPGEHHPARHLRYPAARRRAAERARCAGCLGAFPQAARHARANMPSSRCA